MSDGVMAKVADLVGERLPQSAPVASNAAIRDLGLDSVAIMDLIMAIEDEFQVNFPLDRLGEVHTVEDLSRMVRSLVENRTAPSP